MGDLPHVAIASRPAQDEEPSYINQAAMRLLGAWCAPSHPAAWALWQNGLIENGDIESVKSLITATPGVVHATTDVSFSRVLPSVAFASTFL